MRQGGRFKMLLTVIEKPGGQQNYHLILVIRDAARSAV